MPKSKTKTSTRRLALKSLPVRYIPSVGEIATRERGLGYSLQNLPLPNPDIVLKRMGKDITVYNELLSDAHVGGCFESRKAGVLTKTWALNRGEAPDAATDLVQNAFSRLDMNCVIREILDAPGFGYNISEVLWTFTGGMWLPLTVRQKDPEWFVFGEHGELRFKSMRNPIGIDVPQRKFLKTVHNGGWRNPYGFPELSKVFWPAVFKKGGLKFWATFTEKYGMPHIVAKQPRGKNDEETDKLLYTLQMMVQDAIAVIPDDASVEVKNYAGTANGEVYKEFLAECKSEISIGLLGQTLTTDVAEGGSYAASKTHMEVRKDIVDGDKKLVEGTLNELAQWIIDFNMLGAKAPTCGLYSPEEIDQNLAERDKSLVDQGVRFKKSYYQRAYGLKEDEFEIGAPGAPGAAPVTAFAGKALPAPAKPDNAVDEITDGLKPEELQKQAEGLLKPVFELVKDSASHDELLDKLASIYPDMDTAELEKELTHVIFISDLLAAAQRESAK